ncbi:MAG: hypothetical protein WDN04_03670 [Rhodospirillales bacterium]
MLHPAAAHQWEDEIAWREVGFGAGFGDDADALGAQRRGEVDADCVVTGDDQQVRRVDRCQAHVQNDFARGGWAWGGCFGY